MDENPIESMIDLDDSLDLHSIEKYYSSRSNSYIEFDRRAIYSKPELVKMINEGWIDNLCRQFYNEFQNEGEKCPFYFRAIYLDYEGK